MSTFLDEVDEDDQDYHYYDEPDDRDVSGSVTLYVEVYKWWCPQCDSRNLEQSCEDRVVCPNCGHKFTVGTHQHEHE